MPPGRRFKVRNVIRKRNSFHIRNMIATGKRHGMQTMQASLAELRESGTIDDDVYEAVSANYS